MHYKIRNEDGEVELLTIKRLKDVHIIEKGTPRLGSKCSFRILEKSNFSTGQDNQKPKIIPNLSLAESKYVSLISKESEDPPGESIEVIVGVTSVSESDRLIDICLTRLHVGEVGQFAVVCSRSNSSFLITLELVSLNESPELFELSGEQIVGIVNGLKDEGGKLFKAGFIIDSFHKFSQAFRFLSVLPPMSSEAQKSLTSALRSNMASCHVKNRNWEEAIDLCNLVLDSDEKNVKALYRRGLSFIEIQEYEKAENDLVKAQTLDPGNQAIKNKITALHSKKKALDAKYAQAMKKFFA